MQLYKGGISENQKQEKECFKLPLILKQQLGSLDEKQYFEAHAEVKRQSPSTTLESELGECF